MRQINFIFLLIFLLSCNYNAENDYKNLVLKRLDLKGNVKSLETNINFQNTIFDCCDLGLNEIVNDDFKIIKFTNVGLIESLEYNTGFIIFDHITSEIIKKPVVISEIYNENGSIKSTRIKDKYRKEIGYTNFLYFKNKYHKNNLTYDVDSSRLFLDTCFVIERGTNNKFYKGNLGRTFGYIIDCKKVYDKNGYMLEEMYANIESGLTKYNYDKKYRLKNKIRIYDNTIMDSIIFKYDEKGYLSNTFNKTFKLKNIFYFDNFDNYGNWQSLLIVNKHNKVKVIRKIEYY